MIHIVSVVLFNFLNDDGNIFICYMFIFFYSFLILILSFSTPKRLTSTFCKIVICSNELQPLKTSQPKEEIDGGKEISFNDEHCSKDLEPTKSKEEGDSNTTFSKEEQLAKEFIPILTTELGIKICFNEEH